MFLFHLPRTEQLLLDVFSENAIIAAAADLFLAKTLLVVPLQGGVSNFCDMSAAKVLCCLQMLIGL